MIGHYLFVLLKKEPKLGITFWVAIASKLKALMSYFPNGEHLKKVKDLLLTHLWQAKAFKFW